VRFGDAAKILREIAKSMWTANRKSVHVRHDAKGLPGADRFIIDKLGTSCPEDVKGTTATGSHSNTKLLTYF
jgi:hypothetical protein